MEKKYPKMLIISHNIIDETNNVGKTVLSFLNNWPSENLYSLYLRKEMPTHKRCNSYYQIDDKSVLKSIINKNITCGNVVEVDNITNQNELTNMESTSYRIGNKRIPLVSYARDKIWQIGRWKNSDLVNWLNEVNPDIIFFIPNDYELAFYLLNFVNKTLPKVPIITFYTDDAFYFGQKCKGIDWIRRRNLRKLGEKLANITDCIFTTCPKMSNEYSRKFPSTYYEIGNSIPICENESNFEKSDEIRISYIGNLHSNRWKNVLDVGNAIMSLRELGYNARLYVFSGSDMPDSILKKLKNCTGISWEGKIDNNAVKKEQLKADILLHVEAFDDKSKKSTRLSISTKIFEYLAAGKIILGYGPNDVASMEYLDELGYSVMCVDKKDLRNVLLSLFSNIDLYSEKALKSKEYATLNFNQDTISNKFYDIVLKSYRKEST